jgi:sugar lactone lactonase YvrE
VERRPNREDILEHGGRGRLFSLDPRSGRVVTVLSGLQFANGVAVPDHGRYLVVAETGGHRLLRLWLEGDRRGEWSLLRFARPEGK